MRPLRLTPSAREKVWGATHLEPWFRDSKSKIGEVWFEGAGDLPLLVKFLFTSEKLSVQVHPNDLVARDRHDSRGKTEMWCILAAEPGAKIAAGFRETLGIERLKAAALSGEIEDLLQWFAVEPGDVFFIPAGTVHAIGGGIALCEIQEHSDITYRLYDYGRPRELHLEQALSVSLLGPSRAQQQIQRGNGGEVLVSCEHFVTERMRIVEPKLYEPLADRFQILIAIHGQGRIGGQATQAGDVWYVPPGGNLFEIAGDIELLRTAEGSPAPPE